MDNIAEEALLGCIFIDNNLIDTECMDITPKHFRNPKYGRIYSILLRMRANGDSIDVPAVAAYIAFDKKEKDYFGNETSILLTHIRESVVSASSIKTYVKSVCEEAKKRDLLLLLDKFKAEVDDCSDTTDLSSRLASELTDLIKSSANKEIYDSDEMADEYETTLEKELRDDVEVAIPTGFHDIDKIITGVKRGNILTIAARPSMGKTALATNIAMNMAYNKKHSVMFASIEMSRDEIERRIISRLGMVDLQKVMNPKLANDEELKKMLDGAGRMKRMEFSVIDTGISNVSSIAAAARITKAKKGLDVIVIDHIQLMDDSDLPTRNTSIVNMIRHITRSLKLLAKELNVGIILLSQLSRSVEQRTDKTPLLSDLKDSGSIEQDSDIIMMIYRPAYYADKDDIEAQKDVTTKVIIAKNRNSPSTMTGLAFHGKYASFGNLTAQKQ